MWLTAQLQWLSASGLAMLIAVLAEQTRPGAQVVVVNDKISGAIWSVISYSFTRNKRAGGR
jgi:hypothetical protein